MTRETISYIDPFGTETILSGQPNTEIMIGPTGRYMPTFNIVEQNVPFQAGSRLKNITVNAREVDIPIQIMGLSTSDLRTQIRNLLSVFNPMNGDGKLKVVSEDGTQRILNCRYASGLEIQNEQPYTWATANLVFKAFDPYWYDANTIIQTFTTGTPATFFPFFPLRITSSTVFADTTIQNDGDVETNPVWTITGPGSGIVITNQTTNELININYTLGDGETITVDTTNGNKTVTKNDGTNLYQYLSSDSSLWALTKGSNSVQIEMSGATTDSSVQINYNNRYWGV